MIVASNDPYLRVFSIKDFKTIKIIRSYFGTPLCIDISKDQSLMACGFEDDSFVIFNIKNNFAPLARGVGHKSFVYQVKFDNFL